MVDCLDALCFLSFGGEGDAALVVLRDCFTCGVADAFLGGDGDAALA